jgi:predicted amidohydrolase
MKIALIQMKVVPDKKENLKNAARLLDKAAENKIHLAVLPEIFTCVYVQERFKDAAEAIPNGPAHAMLAARAREHKINIIGGSIVQKENERFYNSCMIFDHKGELQCVHRKTHLFNVDLPTVKFCESEVFTRGGDLTLVKINDMNVGVVICFDIRFPDYIRLLALKGADLIVCPGAFSETTGSAHWELLLRSRAVDNQVYTAGCSPAPYKGSEYPYYGHSMVVDPWGEIICRAGEKEEIIYADISRDKIKNVRENMDLHRHRRDDLYGLEWYI